MNKATEELRLMLLNTEFDFSKDIDVSDVGTFYLEGGGLLKILKLLKDMGYKRVVEKRLPIRFLHPDDKPNTSYETAKQDMLKWHNASLEEIDIE